MKLRPTSKKSLAVYVTGLLLVLAAAGGGYWYSKQDAKPAAPAASSNVPADTPPPSTDTPEARDTDAANLTSAIVSFQVTNNGLLPAAFTAEKTLTAPNAKPAAVKLTAYRNVLVVVGKQAALKSDSNDLVMALQSKCADDKSTVDDFRGTVSVQYVADGKVKCLSTRSN